VTIRRFLALATASVAVLALPATASADDCPDLPAAPVFAQFGDQADYSLVPGADFESSTAGWSLDDAGITGGSETYAVGGDNGKRSLRIDSDGQAISPPICVSARHPSFRLFSRRVSNNWGALTVKLRWTDTSGQTHDTVVGTIGSGVKNVWSPSPSFALATTLPIPTDGSLMARIVFDPEDWGGDYAIDDVYVDPYFQR
jgi:hypothetical protein